MSDRQRAKRQGLHTHRGWGGDGGGEETNNKQIHKDQSLILSMEKKNTAKRRHREGMSFTRQGEVRCCRDVKVMIKL